MPNRRRIVQAAALSLTLGLSAASALAQDAIKVGLLSLTSHSPSIIAEGKGYFAAQNLKVEFVSFQAAQPMAVAIASGDVDFGVTAISGSLISLADKDVIRIIGGALTEAADVPGQRILVSKAAYDQGVTTPAKLRGRSFGITTAGSSFHYMAHKIADKEGFPRSEIHLKTLQKVPAVVAALKSGQIDAWSIVPNIAAALTKDGSVVDIGRVADYIDNYQVTVIFTSKALATGKRELVQRFLNGFEQGVDTYNAALVDKTLSDADTDAVVAMIHKYVYSGDPMEKAGPRIRAGAMRISPKGRLNLKSVEDQLAWFKSENLVPPGVTLNKLVDTSFVATN
jgi:NitT/TauT family transport system substrate-binding protein